MTNLNKYIFTYPIKPTECDTIVPHSTILTELYNILHSNTEHALQSNLNIRPLNITETSMI
jgi:hypothetical protein